MKYFYAIILVIFLASFAVAQIPKTMSYQGVLTDSKGQKIEDGAYRIQFRLYETESGGAAIWEEAQDMMIHEGIFDVILGKVNPLNVSFDKPLWLGITITDGDELEPRVELTASAFSLNAQQVLGESNVFPGNGNVGIGLKEPLENLHVYIPSGYGNIMLETPSYGDLMYVLKNTFTDYFIRLNGNTLRIDNEGQSLMTFYSGRVGIGMIPEEDRFEVAGIIRSATGGFKFPDGSVQTTAASGIGGEGDITAVTAGAGLTGGGESADVTLDIGAGTGLTVSADAVALNTTYTDGQYVNEGQANSINGAMITDGQVANLDLADNAVNSAKIENNSITAADIAPNLLASIDGVSNDGGDVDLVAGSNVTITPDDASNTITISSSGGTGGGDITAVTAGAGLTGGGETADVTLDIGAGTGLTVSADAVALNTTYTDGRYINEGQANSISGAMITDGQVSNADLADNSVNSAKIENNSITTADIAPNLLASIDGVSNDGGNVDLVAGSNVTITPDDASNTITISSSGGTGGGDITAVTAGAGLTGGGETADVTLDIGAGTGLTVSADAVALNTTYTDGQYVNEGQANSISGAMITDGQVANADLADNAVNSAKIENNSITAADIAVNMLASIDGVSNDGGNIDLIAGSNVTITPNDGANTITISASAGAGDNLGNHTAAQNINLNGNWLSGNGENNGIYVNESGAVNINHSLTVDYEFGGYVARLSGAGYGVEAYAGSEFYGSLADGPANAGVYGKHGNGNNGKLGAEDYGAFGRYNNFNEGYLGSQNYGAFGKHNNGNEGHLGSSDYGAYGKNNDGSYGILGALYTGVRGFSSTGNYGHIGSPGYGVYGVNVNYENFGYIGSVNFGVFGRYSSETEGWLGSIYYGAYGYNYTSGKSGCLGSTDYGAYGQSSSIGPFGYLGSEDYGTCGQYRSDGSYGFLGGEAHGVLGQAAGNAAGEVGVYGQVDGSDSYGVFGTSEGPSGGRGVHGQAVASNGIGVYGSAPGTGYAGYFAGRLRANGLIEKPGGGFKIDHPLDPADKYLNHSFVESPDMKNIYDGVIVLDGNGEAVVELPEWFEALNHDFRYQLTCIGGYAQVYISEEVFNNRFKIAGGSPGMKVSWQVTGIRQDAFANAHRIPVEEEKQGQESGKYQNPEEHGVSETLGIGYDEKIQMEEKQQNLAEKRKKLRLEEEQRHKEERNRMEEQRKLEKQSIRSGALNR